MLLEYIKTFPYGKAESIYAEWHPDNIASKKLFEAYEFVVIDTDEDGAVVAIRIIDNAMNILYAKLDEAIDDLENGRVISEEEMWAELDAI